MPDPVATALHCQPVNADCSKFSVILKCDPSGRYAVLQNNNPKATQNIPAMSKERVSIAAKDCWSSEITCYSTREAQNKNV
jgi:hypothetical protein